VVEEVVETQQLDKIVELQQQHQVVLEVAEVEIAVLARHQMVLGEMQEAVLLDKETMAVQLLTDLQAAEAEVKALLDLLEAEEMELPTQLLE
jgi:hypothetical protein